MKQILFAFGTRPEAIKLAPLVLAARKSSLFDPVVCLTGQHREMLDQVIDIFKIEVGFDLDIMKKGQDLFDVTSAVLLGMGDVIKESSPDIVLVQGDTTTSFAAALAAYYHRTPVGHVEAGLRTYDKYSPWPEEINRQMTGRIADLHFAPTEWSRNNLIDEGIENDSVFVTGNTVIDAAQNILSEIEDNGSNQYELSISDSGYEIGTERKFMLVTGHRRESFGQGFLDICKALDRLAAAYPEIDIVYPVHLNPNVRKPVFSLLGNMANIYLIEPLQYPEFMYLMSRSYLILTDSGGIQEEGPSFGIPVLVMRDTTERPEGIEAGTVKLIGTTTIEIEKNVIELISNPEKYQEMSQAGNPYGDGRASERILNALERWFG
ncbi:MAG: UDP-N-acetylglucosamine 2-epimerase (non-hydrolyzing) [Spirochaetales bacterium]|jgi:UDP-N-acetylglucosamine 2-epimerase (non-hydrolysing)|nr:UDP-N-acetylglucosamine 2-epimerase (non-hydrolyzing) [Spirochaetales bacterium]